MYAIFLFNTLKIGEPIPRDTIRFNCRTIGVEPTMLDVATKLTNTIGKENPLYTKLFYDDDFTEVEPGIYMTYLDWNQTAVLVIDTDTMCDVKK